MIKNFIELSAACALLVVYTMFLLPKVCQDGFNWYVCPYTGLRTIPYGLAFFLVFAWNEFKPGRRGSKERKASEYLGFALAKVLGALLAWHFLLAFRNPEGALL